MKKVYIIILLAVLFRLYHINFPVLGWHSWRQSDTATIARNFFYNGFNILHPQINWNGNGTGYVESEFHIYPFIVSLFYAVFGINDMYGRIISIIFSLFTIYGIYLLVRKIMNESTALWSSFIYAILPLNIFYSRAFMPESTMLMCSVYSIYFFSEWIDKENLKYLILTWLFTSLAILIKIPALYLGLPLAFLAIQKYRYKAFSNYKLWLLAFFVLLPVFLWYYHAHQLFLNNGATFGIWEFGTDKWGNFNLWIDPKFYEAIFVIVIPERLLTYPGTILFLIGLFIKRKYPQEKLFDFWLIAVIIYFFIVAEGNMQHEYYQLPFVIPVCVFIGKVMGKALSFVNFRTKFPENKIQSSLALVCLFLIIVLSFLRVQNFMKSEDWNSPVFKIANDVKSNSNKTDLIITISNGDPVYLYHCDRIGWTVISENLDLNYVSQRIKEGAKFITGETNKFESQGSKDNHNKIFQKYNIIVNESEYFIVKLK